MSVPHPNPESSHPPDLRLARSMGGPATSPIVLRDYQEGTRQRVHAALRRGLRRGLIVWPVGAGKTVLFAHLILDLIGGGGRALVIVHRQELADQAVAKLRDVLGLHADIGVVKAERDGAAARIVVASVQTLERPGRLDRLGGGFAVVVVDEAHHAAARSYRAILDHFGISSSEAGAPTLIGVTATPDRGDGVGLDGIFEEIVDELPMLDLIRAGHLVDLKADQVALKADFNALHTRAGDFVDSETEGVLLNADAPTHVARAYRHLAPDRKGIVFTPTVAVAEAAAEALRGVGIQAESLSGATPMDERRNILAALKTGAVQAVANCAVLTEGYDDPTVSCIAVMKLTKSRGHFVQMIGRGTRTYPGKTDCHILDTVGCSARHDLMTVASLFGLPSDRLKAKTVGQAIAEEEAGAEEPQIVTPHGRLVAASVNLFRARPASWVPTNTGRFVLPGGDGTFVLRPAFGDAWDVLHVPRGQPPRVLATGLTIGYAQGLAEGKAKEMGAAALIDRAAPWRQAAPSEKQILTLRRFGVPTSAIRTRGEASDAITAAIAAGGV